MNALRVVIPVTFLALLGCAAKSERDRARPSGYKPLSQRVNDTNGYTQDEGGNWVPKSNQRSSYEKIGESPYFKGTQKKKEFKVGEYQRKSWWGNRGFQVKPYDGNTDGSRFQTTARQQGMAAREGGRSAGMTGTYETGDFATGAAREAGMDAVPRVVDAETEERRRVYQAPEILNWNQRRAISRDETKSLLGR